MTELRIFFYREIHIVIAFFGIINLVKSRNLVLLGRQDHVFPFIVPPFDYELAHINLLRVAGLDVNR